MESMKNLVNYVIYKDKVGYNKLVDIREEQFIDENRVSILLYYAYGYYLLENNKNYKDRGMNTLFESDIIGGPNGPEVVEAEDYIRGNDNFFYIRSNKLEDEEASKIIDFVIKAYGKYDTDSLVAMVKENDEAWQNSYAELTLDDQKKSFCMPITDKEIYKNFFFDVALNEEIKNEEVKKRYR